MIKRIIAIDGLSTPARLSRGRRLDGERQALAHGANNPDGSICLGDEAAGRGIACSCSRTMGPGISVRASAF